MDENPGIKHVCAPCSTRTRLQAQNGPHNTKKRGVFPLSNFRVAQTEAERLHSALQSLWLVFKKCGRDAETMTTIFFSDEARFHLWGHVNAQNYSIGSTNNPHIFEETSLHPIKVGISYAISKHRVGDVLCENNSQIHRGSRGRWAVRLNPARWSHCSHGRENYSQIFRRYDYIQRQVAVKMPRSYAVDFFGGIFKK